MRRHLLIVRHAKSAWDDPNLTDHDRPLAPRGVRALRRLSDYLSNADQPPDAVLCSSSRRTLDTLAGIRQALPDDTLIDIDELIYGAHHDTLLERLRALDGTIGCAMMVGHNPGLEELIIGLAGTGDMGLITQVTSKFPTGAVATLSFEGTWADLDWGTARLDDLFMPRKPRPD